MARRARLSSSAMASNPIDKLAIALHQTSGSPATVRATVTNNNDHPVTVLTYQSPLDPAALALGLLSITPSGASQPLELPTIKMSRQWPPPGDALVSLDAGEEEGSVTTRSFEPPGDGLYVNCDASGGWIAVQLLDDQEQILAASERLTGDHDRCEVKWLKGALGERQRQAVALRFTMRSASLYSFWFEGG